MKELLCRGTRRVLDCHLGEFLQEVLDGRTYPGEVEKFIDWDDHKVWSLLMENRDREPVRRLLDRRHFRLAFETNDHPDHVELERFDWLKDLVKAEFGKERVRFDEAAKAPYSYERPPVFVFYRDEHVPLKDRSSLVRSLKKIEKCRVYAEQGIREKVERFCNEFWKKRESERGGKKHG